jgi:hypothetical protein
LKNIFYGKIFVILLRFDCQIFSYFQVSFFTNNGWFLFSLWSILRTPRLSFPFVLERSNWYPSRLRKQGYQKRGTNWTFPKQKETKVAVFSGCFKG